MFKIAKLENVKNENVNIDFAWHECYQFKDGKSILNDKFKTLTFDITGDEYSLSFDFNCKLEKLLEIPMNEQVDFNNYIFKGETWLCKSGICLSEPEINIKITRYLKNKFIVFISFSTEYFTNDECIYSGMIEFTFNLDDYLK